MGNEPSSPATVDLLVWRISELCRAYEYYYDAYYGENAPFADQRPDPAEVAKALQNLCRFAHKALLLLNAYPPNPTGHGAASAAPVHRVVGRTLPDNERSEGNTNEEKQQSLVETELRAEVARLRAVLHDIATYDRWPFALACDFRKLAAKALTPTNAVVGPVLGSK